MAKDSQEFGSPDWKLEDAPDRPSRSPQKVWDVLNTPNPLSLLQPFAYMDRIGPEMFVGRYDYGKCSAVPIDAGEHHHDDDEQYGPVCYPAARRNHAYVATITPKGADSICIYCGTTIDGCPKAKLRDIPWDEPWEKPRRATESELKAMGIKPIPEHTMLYLDEVDGHVSTGRFRVGQCKEGGTHEAVLCWWEHSRDPMFSYCVFCGEHWNGPPPGYWEEVEPSRSVAKVLVRHSEDVRKGKY